MLNEESFEPRTTASGERRRATRSPIQGHVVIQWIHDPDETIRYRVLDRSDTGLRLRLALPIVEGLSGRALNFLPSGEAIDSAFTVAWCRPDGDGGYEAGLRYLSAA